MNVVKTPLIWSCDNLNEVRGLLNSRADNPDQTTLKDTARILAIPKIPQKLDQKITEILELFG